MRALALALFLTACNPEPPPAAPPGSMSTQGEAVVNVNGKPVTQAQVDAITRRIPPEQIQMMKDRGQWDQFIERIAIGQVLWERAIEKKLHEDPKVMDALAMSQRDVLAAELLDQVSKESVTDASLKEAYDKRKVQFGREQVKARHILVKEEALAKDLFEKLKAGGDFAALAKEHSTDPGSKDAGGDLGWFESGRMVPEFNDAAFAATVNDIVGPIQTQFGFHIIQVTEKRPGIPLEEVKDQLSEMVKRDAVEKYIEAIKTEAKIEKPGAAPAEGAAPATADGAAPAAPAPAGH